MHAAGAGAACRAGHHWADVAALLCSHIKLQMQQPAPRPPPDSSAHPLLKPSQDQSKDPSQTDSTRPSAQQHCCSPADSRILQQPSTECNATDIVQAAWSSLAPSAMALDAASGSESELGPATQAGLQALQNTVGCSGHAGRPLEASAHGFSDTGARSHSCCPSRPCKAFDRAAAAVMSI